MEIITTEFSRTTSYPSIAPIHPSPSAAFVLTCIVVVLEMVQISVKTIISSGISCWISENLYVQASFYGELVHDVGGPNF